MQAVLRTAEKAAGSAIPVLIEGESGVGKELIARAIHGSGERRTRPFVAVNCGAMPENLVESILFGHEKGSFTGATERHVGKFVEAAGGTLFLDEVGELPPAAQVKLLRAIQEGEVEPVGARRAVRVDVRIVSATNRDLIADVKEGRFREDLFYRLHVFPITVPPLRERPEDIPELTRHFLARFAAEEGKRIRHVHPDALALLAAFRWPGNVRQLENAVFRGVVLADGDSIGIAEFPQIAAQVPARPAPSPPQMPQSPLSSQPSQPSRPAQTAHEALPVLPPGAATVAADFAPDPRDGIVPGASSDFLRLLDAQGEVRPLDDLEAEIIRYAITHYRNQMSEVARRLRIGRSTLYRRLESLGFADEAAERPDEAVASGRQSNKIA
jgi:DNA-binding NtrC family response regulator